jgi:hypothetical protein
MYILKKCTFKGCTRSGYVALEERDTVCNIHKNADNNNKDEEEESEEE